MHVIGTAGHVDHGKTTLIAALTGTNPDRLKEEQTREMTIDLGFASIKLPNGELVGIIDVPGHRDFIENMLAGVGGIDAALFVVAADEGIMPQTREHLAILDLLQIPTGLIVITKIDLIDDPEWLSLVEADIRQAVRGTVLQDVKIVRVSARTHAGLDDLVAALEKILANQPSRPDLNRPRLPVDRVFTMPGFGTVVTGTLSDGKFRVGDEVETMPGRLHGRVRGLQTHNRKEEEASPGSRTAINISGLNVDQIRRGDVVTHPETYQPARWLDVHYRHLADASASLKHSTEVKLFIGTTEVVARARLLGKEELAPGETGWLQLELHEPVIALRGDHFILRRPSPGETIGGGIVIDPQPVGRHKRFDGATLRHLELLGQGTPEDVILQASQVMGAAPIREIIQRAKLEGEVAADGLAKLISQGRLVVLEEGSIQPGADTLVVDQGQWQTLVSLFMREVQTYHKTHPLRRGIPREELKSRLKLTSRVFNGFLRRLVRGDQLAETGAIISQVGFEIHPTPEQSVKIMGLLKDYARSPFAPPSIKESQAEVGEEIFTVLVETGQLVQVSSEVAFRKEDYETLVERVRKHLEAQGAITVAEFRDMFNTSRRYSLAFLEYLDEIGVTVREGDLRRLKRER